MLSKKLVVNFALISLLISSTVITTGLSSYVEVSIPDYTLTRVGNIDYVEIPGGRMLLEEEGRPMVPYYVKLINYSKEYRVQDVILEERSGLRTATGLRLPTVVLHPLSNPETNAETTKGWYPVESYRWRILMNNDGSSTLVIFIFPFFYNPETTECRYYTYYRFRIIDILSTVSILEMTTDKTIYDPGEKVTINVSLNNSGKAMDVVANALIRQYGSERIVDSLPLMMLRNVMGEASFSTIWNTEGFPTDYYYVEITLNDTSGNWLDKRTCEFRLGRPLINITSFSVEPQHFKIGDKVRITLEAVNTGSTNLSGRCIFTIWKGNSSVWYSYQNFSSLAPKASLRFTSTWDTSLAEKGALYYVVSYVSYESQTTPPAVVVVSTNYPPVARFSYTPTKVGLVEEVSFDASASNDPDGTISRFEWDFGDGGRGSGSNVKHSYRGLGVYEVTLTVTDNEGASNATSKSLTVVMSYYLNVSSNVEVTVEGSGEYKEGDELTLSASPSVSMPGLLGLLGAKYVFKQWVGFLNSTESSVRLVFAGYEPRLEMHAVYAEDYTGAIIVASVLIAVAVVVVAVSLRRRKSTKLPRPPELPPPG